MESTNYKLDFIKRTLEIAEKAVNKDSVLGFTEYDVTLLINCMIGIVYVASGLYNDKCNRNTAFADAYLSIQNKYCKYELTDTNKKHQVIAVRDAVAHHFIECKNIDGKIAEVVFTDSEWIEKKKERIVHTIISFTVENLKSFIIEIGKFILAFQQTKFC